MKFGHEFYKSQRPQWANAYLNYDDLKQTLKRRDFGDRRYEILRRSLSEQAVRLDQFVDKQSSLVSLWFQAIKSRFSIQPAASPVLPDWTKVALPELRDLEFNLWEALSFIEQLDVFCRLNRDAIARIIQKARATTENWTWQNHGNGPLYVRPWSKEMTLMTALLGALQRTINLRLEDGDTASSRSLILEVVDPVALGCSQDDVVEEIIADDSSALMVVLASPVSYLENQAMLYSVTQVAILHHSIDCIESLLDEITVTLGGELCIHQDPLQQLITQFCRGSSLTVNTSNHSTLDKIIKHLSPYQHHLLWAKDWRQRLPLHYAAQHGLVEISSQMIKLMGLSATLEVDAFGETPLSLAAISGHSDIVNMFVDLDMRRLDGKSLVFTEEHGTLVNRPQNMRSLAPAQVIGHRGLGLNENELRRLQIGEHTLLSLESALDNGADFIEFDVQVTRDQVPVIYHDWAVSETGLDTPVHSLTHAQWMAISDSQTDPHHDAPRGRLPWDERCRPSQPPRRSSRSLCGRQNPVSNAMLQRMKHTVDYSIRNMKGNTRGDFIHDRFVTLRQLLRSSPKTLASTSS
ncbi:uncharacterized protein PG998_002264 [Apiospora kogelbergensis]|uniref:uncharacterized protein n=1 Tax=Apiospora kogelbergensis TaxID=1337665 RepID=UPI00312FFDFC